MDFGNCPKVSIIITTYKRKKEMVVRAVKSAINQTYLNTEIVVVDDSPSDYLHREDVRQAILALGDERIKVIWHDTNRGACAARNTAIRASNGEYVIYLDDDDEFLPEMIEKRLAGFTDSDIGLVYSKRYLCPNGDKSKMYVPEQKMIAGDIFKYVMQDNIICAFPMVRRECFDTCGMFDEEQLSAQDYEMWLRILQKYKANYVDEPLAIVYLHDEGRITSTPYKAIQGTERLCSIYRSYYRKHPYAYHFRKRDLCMRYMYGGNRKKAFQNFIMAALCGPTDVISNLRLLRMLLTYKPQT